MGYSVSAALAELIRSNSNFFNAAAAATQSWLTFWTPLSHQQGCAMNGVVTTDSGCFPDNNDIIIDCSTYITAGISMFAGLQQNVSIQEKYTPWSAVAPAVRAYFCFPD
jgi:hypothetical protein